MKIMNNIDVKYASDELTEALRVNSKEVTKFLQDNPKNNDWINRFIPDVKFFKKKYTLEDFELRVPKNEKDYKTFYDNAITLYEHLNHLPGYILSDERFWLWLMLDKFYEVTIATMPVTKESTFKNHWLYTQSTRRAIFFGVLSRLYFRVALSVNEKAEDPYHYTKFAFNNQYRIREFGWRNYSSEHHIILGALKGIEKFLNDHKGIVEDNDSYTGLASYISQLGSAKLLDVMDEKYIEEKTYNFLEQYYSKKSTS